MQLKYEITKNVKKGYIVLSFFVFLLHKYHGII